MTKRTRLPMPDSEVFAERGSKVKWPTLRGAYLTDETVAQLRKLAFGVIFLDGMYHTRLNFDKGPSEERAVFFEHLHRVDGDALFLLVWIGNYHAGSIFHCAWQFPQMTHWPWQSLERAAFATYKLTANTLYHGSITDSEVKAFVERRK